MRKISCFIVLAVCTLQLRAQSILVSPASNEEPFTIKNKAGSTIYGNLITPDTTSFLRFYSKTPANNSNLGQLTARLGIYSSDRFQLTLEPQKDFEIGTRTLRYLPQTGTVYVVTSRLFLTSDGNVGINLNTPSARLHVQNTGAVVASGYGYTQSFRAGSIVNGVHASPNQENDAIGVVGYGDGAKSGYYFEGRSYRNIGVYGSAGESAYHSVGVWGTSNRSGETSSAMGIRGEANNTSLYGYSYGVFGVASGVASSSLVAAIYGYANTTGPSYAGYFQGKVYVSGTILNPSDARFKKNMKGIDGTIAKIMQLKPTQYEYQTEKFEGSNFSKGKHFGFVAQNVGEVFPELVEEAEIPDQKQKGEKYMAVNYLEMIPVLTKAIQEQQAEIEYLKSELKKLHKQNK